tara:strand:- start:182 stop:412 length:231 start_codon:yes stop_codon:yes gene_type:complete
MKDLIEQTQQVLDGTYDEEKTLEEISLGKIGSTVLLSRLLGQLKKVQDKPLQDVLKTMSYMIFTTSLQHKKDNKRR